MELIAFVLWLHTAQYTASLLSSIAEVRLLIELEPFSSADGVASGFRT